jgi:hypothetical protein
MQQEGLFPGYFLGNPVVTYCHSGCRHRHA